MAEPREGPGRLLPALRVAFLVAVVLFAWLGLRGRFDELGHAVRATSLPGVVGALGLVLLGLAATGLLWVHLMGCLGARLPWRTGLAMFFVGQLGKYIPGSVWSIGAQAQMAGRNGVPVRTTVAAGLVFLGYHLVTGIVAGMLVVLLGGLAAPWPDWLSWIALTPSAVALAPGVVRRASRLLVRAELRIRWAGTLLVLALMSAAWAAYALALVLLAPGLPWADVAAYGAAFALAYAVGVVVVVAPAGVGAREALFVLLLTPLSSVAAATAVALLARAVHSAADGLMAAGWWSVARLRTTSSRP